jgi:hypothetical protein
LNTKNIILLSLFTFLLVVHAYRAQERVITAGIQYKPLFSSSFFKTGPIEISQNNIDFTITPKSGYCMGMIIRRGLTAKISAETGINIVKRNYELSIIDSGFKGESGFAITSYEIPLQGLVFIRLSKNIFMDASGGLSLDFFPTSIFTFDTYFKNKGYKKSWVLPSLLANIGWEYRTPKSGYIYIGASYHRPFTNIFLSEITYNQNSKNEVVSTKLSGNYLTVDLRYFFHEKPIKKKKKKKKENPSE